jgi:hypothetical protein
MLNLEKKARGMIKFIVFRHVSLLGQNCLTFSFVMGLPMNWWYSKLGLAKQGRKTDEIRIYGFEDANARKASK